MITKKRTFWNVSDDEVCLCLWISECKRECSPARPQSAGSSASTGWTNGGVQHTESGPVSGPAPSSSSGGPASATAAACQQRRGSLQLWQFLVAMLDDPGSAACIAWTGRGLEFKLVEPEEVGPPLEGAAAVAFSRAGWLHFPSVGAALGEGEGLVRYFGGGWTISPPRTSSAFGGEGGCLARFGRWGVQPRRLAVKFSLKEKAFLFGWREGFSRFFFYFAPTAGHVLVIWKDNC